MHFTTPLILAGLWYGMASADFLLLTDKMPEPTNKPSLKNAWAEAKYTRIVNSRSQERFSTAMKNLKDEIKDANKERDEFVRKEKHDYPLFFTADHMTATITKQPDWYTALPSKVKKANDDIVKARKDAKVEAYNDAAKEFKDSGAESLRTVQLTFGLVVVFAAGLVLL